MQCPKCYATLISIKGQTYCPACNGDSMRDDDDRPYAAWLEFDSLSPEVRDQITNAANRPQRRKPEATLLLVRKQMTLE